jgi:manganese-dependent inorganic pyrophosphatase
MNQHIIAGHINPDTDSVVSSIVYSEFKNRKGQKATAILTGKPNKETEFVLNYFKIKKPQKIKTLAGKKVVLVDHGSLNEAYRGAEKAKIIEVIDHHKMSGISTPEPIFYRAEPIGSTSTIIAEISKENGLALNKNQAGLLLCGIISDTLKFTSPTTAARDKKIASELAKISKININAIAKKMFEAKSDISGKSADEIINADYKKFEAGKTIFGFGVCETTNPKFLLKKEKKIVMALEEKKTRDNLDLIFFAIIDILQQKSFLYLIGAEEKAIAKKCFGAKTGGDVAILQDIISRKKQMIPPIFKTLS